MNRTMQSLSAAFVVLVAGGLAACHDPIAAHQSPVLLPPQIEMTSQSLADDTAVLPPVLARMPGTGQLDVSVTVQNRTDSPMTLEYQYAFLKGGRTVEQYSGWHTLRIPPRTDGLASPVRSLEPDVDDFRMRFRWGQYN